MTSNADAGDLIATLRIAGHGDHLMRGYVTVGRDPRADGGATIEVDGDPLVSKSHLCIDIDQGDLIITDLGSSNGTFLHHGAGETAVPSDRWIPIPVDAEIEFGDQRMTIERAAPTASPDLDADTDDDATIEYTPSAPSTPPGPAAVNVAPAAAAEVPVFEHIACVQCHRELPPGSKFCDGCGNPVMPATEPASQPGLESERPDDVDRTVVIPPGGIVAVHAPAPLGPPPGPYGHHPLSTSGPGAAVQPAGGLVFVDPLATTSSKGRVAKVVLLGIVALVVVGLVVYGLVTVFGGGDDSSASVPHDAPTFPTEVDADGDVIGFS